MRKQKLVPDSMYHVYNRGVEKRAIFIDYNDRLRFVKGLATFNDRRPVTNSDIKFNNLETYLNQRKLLVDILAFCLMPNHFHLLLMPRVENGITEFMRKLGTGYVNYFNLKHKRVGTLFQGKFKSVLVDNESQFIHIPYYIHLNPLDIIQPNWKENGIKNRKDSLDFLDSYKWSSHSVYRGNTNFPFVINKDILNEYFIDEDGYSESFYDFISDFDFSDISDLLLE